MSTFLQNTATIRPPAETAAASVSLIVPTYAEAENLPHLLPRIEAVRESSGLNIQLHIMDDDSGDDTPQVVAAYQSPIGDTSWVHLHTRTTDRGLSPSVIDGIKQSDGDYVIVMDADLSHPPEALPSMVEKLKEGHDFVIGSRYTAGGGTDDDWGFGRWLNSKVATWMARPFTNVSDPMAGFFGFPRYTLDGSAPMNPVGYKIGLEIIVKARCFNVAEVPIQFAQRQHGYSKLTFKEQLRYVQHLRRLLIFKYPNWSYISQFAFVGSVGLAVNLAVLTAMLWMGAGIDVALAGGIAVSLFCNFLLNRRFTFSYAINGSVWKQFLGFTAACSLGMLANFGVARGSLAMWTDMVPQIAAMLGVAGGMAFNFLSNRYLVFRGKR